MFSPSLKYSPVTEGAVAEIRVPGCLTTGRQGPSALASRPLRTAGPRPAGATPLHPPILGPHLLSQGQSVWAPGLAWGLLLPLLNLFSRVQLCATPQMAAHQALPSLGFSRQEHWSGLPFPSMRESEVTQSCWTLRDPMDCSPPGSSIHGIFQARVLEWGAIAFSRIYMRHQENALCS